MAPAPPTPTPRARFGLKAKLFIFLLAAALSLALAAYLRNLQTSLISEARAQAALDTARPPRPIADVAQAVRAMKLVTVEIDTTVKVERSESSWRGDVRASIEVPVRLHYGTDLSQMTVDRAAWSALLGARGGYIVQIPRPTRIATEVFSEREAPLVSTGWLRLRSMAGEYYLSQARAGASDEARELVLLPQDAAKVEQVTKEQVTTLIKSLTGPDTHVQVTYLPN
ncbi:MAG TPA: hypothetical protein VD997_14840 [Phycisphaerales bacterium]|nr:hypothetical protein [Phycisphaerales bacterium]